MFHPPAADWLTVVSKGVVQCFGKLVVLQRIAYEDPSSSPSCTLNMKLESENCLLSCYNGRRQRCLLANKNA